MHEQRHCRTALPGRLAMQTAPEGPSYMKLDCRTVHLVRQRVSQQVDVHLPRVGDFVPAATATLSAGLGGVVQSIAGEDEDDLAVDFEPFQVCLAGAFVA